MKRFEALSGRSARVGLSAMAVAAVLAGGLLLRPSAEAFWVAHAQTHDDGGDHEGGPKGKGGQGAGHDGGEGGHDGGEGGHDGGESGHDGGEGGQNGKGAQGGNGQGAGKGQQGAGSGGGRPVWAGEGIPEVELGRLNVARSPDHVFVRAYDEALATMSPAMVDFYNQSLDQMIYDLSINWDTVSIIDSPLQNLALLEDALDGNLAALNALGITNDVETLMAAFLGTASDKTVPITTDTVIAVTTILGAPVTGAEAQALAADAESVRVAILAGHG